MAVMPKCDTGRVAVEICAGIRASRPGYTAEAASLTVCGETGEMVEALRRHLGLARRAGSIEELSDELADVEIAAYVFAAVMGDVTALTRSVFLLAASRLYQAPVLSPERQALLVFTAAGRFAEARLFEQEAAPMLRLAYVVDRNRTLADLLGVDLPAAIEAKAAVIMSRGFGAQREVPA